MQRHYFIAIQLPREVKSYLSEFTRRASDTYPFQRWVHKEDYHITLAFLGPSKESQWKACMDELRGKIQSLPAFSVRLSHCGVFGATKSPRIFWCGMSEESKLMSLQKQVAEVCKSHGYRLDEKPFRPHVTLARKYGAEIPFTQSDLNQCDSLMGDGIVFTVNAITLYESHVEKEQKYQELQTIYIGEPFS